MMENTMKMNPPDEAYTATNSQYSDNLACTHKAQMNNTNSDRYFDIYLYRALQCLDIFFEYLVTHDSDLPDSNRPKLEIKVIETH